MEEILKIPSRRIPWERIAINSGCVAVGVAGLCTGITVAVKDNEIKHQTSLTDIYQTEAKDNLDLLNISEETQEPLKRQLIQAEKELLGITIAFCTHPDFRGKEVVDKTTGRVFKCDTAQK